MWSTFHDQEVHGADGLTGDYVGEDGVLETFHVQLHHDAAACSVRGALAQPCIHVPQDSSHVDTADGELVLEAPASLHDDVRRGAQIGLPSAGDVREAAELGRTHPQHQPLHAGRAQERP